MPGRRTTLEDLLRDCTVRVLGDEPGAGFFVAPGLVLTCAHVVGRATSPSVVLVSDGTEHSSRVKEILDYGVRPIPTLGTNYPDLSLLSVDVDHPCVGLDLEWPESGQVFQAYGFPMEGGSVVPTPVSLSYSGKKGDEPHVFIDLGSGTVKPGMSGGALLNLRSSGVCGIVVASRDPSASAGGLAVPWTAVEQQLLQVLESNWDFHQADKRWADAGGHTSRSRIATRWPTAPVVPFRAETLVSGPWAAMALGDECWLLEAEGDKVRTRVFAEPTQTLQLSMVGDIVCRIVLAAAGDAVVLQLAASLAVADVHVDGRLRLWDKRFALPAPDGRVLALRTAGDSVEVIVETCDGLVSMRVDETGSEQDEPFDLPRGRSAASIGNQAVVGSASGGGPGAGDSLFSEDAASNDELTLEASLDRHGADVQLRVRRTLVAERGEASITSTVSAGRRADRVQVARTPDGTQPELVVVHSDGVARLWAWDDLRAVARPGA